MTLVANENKLKWDRWYYNICEEVAKNTKCFSRQVGAILVRDKSIFSQGYNGPPRGIPPCDRRWETDKKITEYFYEKFGRQPEEEDIKGKCPRQVLGFKSGQGLEWCVAGHGERNAIINAARNGIYVKHSVMYMNCAVPCTPCLVEIMNAGIREIVITSLETYDSSAMYLLKRGYLKYRVYSHLCKHENCVVKYCKECDSLLEGEW